MAWTYLVGTAVSASDLENGSGPSPIAKSTDIAKAFYCPECLKIDCIGGLFGTILKPSPSLNSRTGLKSCTAVSLAKTFPLLALEKVWKVSEAVFFLDCVPWSKKSSPLSCSWKTSQPLELGVFERSSFNLQIWGMTVAGLVYQPLKLEPRTLEKGGSYWATPKASEIEESYENYIARMKRSPDPKTNTKVRPSNLAVQVKAPQFWPTPAYRDYKGVRRNLKKGENVSGKGVSYGMDLTQAVRHKDSLVGGKLNPTWIEWLMGVPLGWTELNPWAMEWFRPKSKKRL